MIKVTNENRAEFVSLYLEHVLNSAVLDRLVIITTDELQPHSATTIRSRVCSHTLKTLAFLRCLRILSKEENPSCNRSSCRFYPANFLS